MAKSELLIKAGWNHLIGGRYEEYEDCLGRARAALEQEKSREAEESLMSLQGELMLLQAMSGISDLEQAEPALQAARDRMGGRSRLCPADAGFLFLEAQPLFRYLKEPGSADVVAARLRRVMRLLKETAGPGAGTAELFEVQLSYYRGGQAAAQESAVRVFQTALAGGQDITAASAAYYLCQIALNKADVPLWNTFREALSEIGRKKDTAGYWAGLLQQNLLLSLTTLAYTSRFREHEEFGNIPVGNGWRTLENGIHPELLLETGMVHIKYLAYSGQYEAALWKLQEAERMAASAGAASPPSLAYYHLYRAFCYVLLGFEVYALREAKVAMDLLAPDRLWWIAAEFTPFLNDLLTAAAARYKGAQEAITGAGGRTFEKLEKIRNTVIGDYPVVAFTGRELTVVDCLSKGASSRAEIAAMMSVSEYTVKRHLENIYRKAGTSNTIKIAEYARRYRLEQQRFKPRNRNKI